VAVSGAAHVAVDDEACVVAMGGDPFSNSKVINYSLN